jgi:CBS domain containing-hemolysin-like protein
LLNGWFVAGEFAIVAVERSRVEKRAREGDRTAQRILVSLRNLSFELSGAQLGITATSLVLGAIAEPSVARLIDPLLARSGLFPGASTTMALSLALALGLATGAQVVFGELVPKNLALARPYRSAVLFGIPMQVVNRLLRPLILLLDRAANATVRLLGIEPLEELAGVRSMEELELMIRSSGAEGQLDDDEMELLTRAITFTEKVAADAMVPRVSLIGLRGDEPVSELRRIARKTGHSRFPVYDESLDDILGIVHVKDWFAVPAEQRAGTTVREIARPPLIVPETRPLQRLLTDLQRAGRGLAVVADEYGGTAGIVTVEDLLEEIFGEIADEHDAETPAVLPGSDVDVLSGLLHRHELEELTGFEWPEGRYETLGGFLVARLGRFPVPGEVVQVDDWAFEVVQMDGRRIGHVKVRRPGSADPQQEPP